MYGIDLENIFYRFHAVNLIFHYTIKKFSNKSQNSFSLKTPKLCDMKQLHELLFITFHIKRRQFIGQFISKLMAITPVVRDIGYYIFNTLYSAGIFIISPYHRKVATCFKGLENLQ